jgi:hypothetical protein
MTAPSCHFCGEPRYSFIVLADVAAAAIAGPIQPSIISRNQIKNVRRKMAPIAGLLPDAIDRTRTVSVDSRNLELSR